MKKVISMVLILFTTINLVFSQNESLMVKLWNQNTKKEFRTSGEFAKITLDKNAINKLYFSKQAEISLKTVDENNNSIITDLDLVKTTPVRIKYNNSEYTSEINLPILYRGKIRGSKKANNVMLTISKNYLSFQIIFEKSTTIITKEENGSRDSFLQYNSKNLKVKSKPFSCGTLEPDFSTKKRLQTLMKKSLTEKSVVISDKPVFVFIDCTKKLYDHNNSEGQGTINYIFSIWNGISTAYINEQLDIQISEINIWTNPDPFDTSTRDLGIQSFAAHYQDNYWGNIAMLLDWNNQNAGVAGGYGFAKSFAPNVCGNYDSNPDPSWQHGSFIYNDLNYFGNYQNFPSQALSEQVYICTHELGHLLGSWHTHSCNWLLSTMPNVYGALDNCEAVEGNCTAGPTPTNGGTFMSYCLGAGEFMNFNNGFGEYPGSAIRIFVATNTCIPNNTECLLFNTVGALPNSGTYLYEAAYDIEANGVINGNTETYVKIDAGNRVVLKPGFKSTFGSKVKVIIDGCGGR